MIPTPKQGFSLAEILIAVAIVMMLAGIAVVSFETTAEDALTAACEQQLQRVRTGVDYYAFQHQEIWPGWENGAASFTENAFVNQLTQATDQNGDWASPGTAGYPYGPYLVDGFPANPFNDLETVAVVPPAGADPYPDDSTGWVYYAATGVFRANSMSQTPEGENIFDL